MTSPRTIIKLLLLLLPAGINAEISGSGSPNLLCGVIEVSGNIFYEHSAQPLAGVTITLADEDDLWSAVTGADGTYSFEGVCDDEYELSVLETTLPAGVVLTFGPQDEEAIERLSTYRWEIDFDDFDNRPLNFGFAPGQATGCPLTLSAECSVASLPTEVYQCNKQIHELSMVWNGSSRVKVVAFNGKTDKPALAEFTDVSPGDVVTVTGMQDAPDDVVWQVYDVATDILLGESRFRLDCDDESMDGPEDCLSPQGNGKDDKENRINEWLLFGMQDSSGLMDCATPQYTSSCSFEPVRADCETIEKAHALTLQYRPGTCDDSRHHQPGKARCEGDLNLEQSVTVELEDGEQFMVVPGEIFTIATDGSDTDLQLRNDGGEQEVRIHTSCSKPLAVGDRFGAIELLAINGLGAAAPVDYQVGITNKDTLPRIVTLTETINTAIDSSLLIAPGQTLSTGGSSWVTATADNVITARTDNGCEATDQAVTHVSPLSSCGVNIGHVEIHDKELRWSLSSDELATATIGRISLQWNNQLADKLKEILLDGDKFYDKDVESGSATLDALHFEGEVKKRRLGRGDQRQLRIKFDNEIEDDEAAFLEQLNLEILFEEGCQVSSQQAL